MFITSIHKSLKYSFRCRQGREKSLNSSEVNSRLAADWNATKCSFQNMSRRTMLLLKRERHTSSQTIRPISLSNETSITLYTGGQPSSSVTLSPALVLCADFMDISNNSVQLYLQTGWFRSLSLTRAVRWEHRLRLQQRWPKQQQQQHDASQRCTELLMHQWLQPQSTKLTT